MRRVLALAVLAPMTVTGAALAQTPAPPPEVLDPDLAVRTTVSGLTQPTSMAFIGNERLPGAREGERPGQAGQERRRAGHRPRPRGELELGARPARHRAAPEVQAQRLGLPVLEREQDRRRQHRRRRRAADGQPDRPLRVGGRPARLRPQHHQVPGLPAGRARERLPGQPRRRRHPLRPRREAVRDRRRHRPPRPDAEPRHRPVRPAGRRRPVRRARARRPAPHRRDRPARRRRRRPARQPVLARSAA